MLKKALLTANWNTFLAYNVRHIVLQTEISDVLASDVLTPATATTAAAITRPTNVSPGRSHVTYGTIGLWKVVKLLLLIHVRIAVLKSVQLNVALQRHCFILFHNILIVIKRSLY